MNICYIFSTINGLLLHIGNRKTQGIQCCRSQEYQASDEYQNTSGKSILTCLQFDGDVNSAVEAQKSGYDIRKLCQCRNTW